MQRSSDENQQWTQDLNQDLLSGGASDVDFTKFLELGNDFGNFDNADQHQHHHQHQHQNHHAPSSGLDTPMGRLTFSPNGHVQALSPQQTAMLQNMDLDIASLQAQLGYPQMQQQSSSAPMQQFQQYPVYQQMQQPYQHQVPPTPVSNEMQATKYVASMDPTGQIIFERQQASFTPLVSPAQTPIDNPWAMPDYVLNEDFFSPLTSPAIEAQAHYASTNTTSSPVDLNSEPPATRKSRKKLNPTSRVASTRTARSSPTTKAMSRRKQASPGALSLDVSSVDLARPTHLLPSQTISSEDSVSPEPSAESLMRPPPIPQARTPNALRSQSRDGNAPATPATLMKVAGRRSEVITNIGHAAESSEVMEDITLPPAADTDMSSRVLPGLDTQIVHDDDSSTPTLSAKTPKLSADDTPRSAGTRQSGLPQDSARPTRGGRMSKKRQSVSQATMSPALRPKISPSISPLVPSTSAGMPMISPETSALYLASKSNYQNILDGTHLPGVSYPETLAENLSSKRTSHKLAEQGRRNRINLALKEIETLLPASIMAANKKDKPVVKEESGDASDKLGGAQGTSKASTVEMAIVYIKSLQAELKETKDKLEAAEKSLADGSSSRSGSQSSEPTNA